MGHRQAEHHPQAGAHRDQPADQRPTGWDEGAALRDRDDGGGDQAEIARDRDRGRVVIGQHRHASVQVLRYHLHPASLRADPAAGIVPRAVTISTHGRRRSRDPGMSIRVRGLRSVSGTDRYGGEFSVLE
ncbi:hypothetical protein BTZ20_4951 [Rhodococcus sp. MTM3W5.2]|nr:hypothetical protein BTZ20_4951 [Rhodococcus sp. MTM3W5.2]